MDIQHQRGFRFRVIGHEQAAGVAIFSHIKEQRWLVAQWLPALFNALVIWVDHQNFTAAVSGVYAPGLCGVVQSGHPFTGICNACFQLQGGGINHPDLRRVGDRANVESIVQQQQLTRPIRASFFIALAEQQAVFDLAGSSIDSADAAVQRIADIKRFTIRRELQSEVFQIGMRQADGVEGLRIQCVNRPTLHMFKAFGAGDVQRITLRA